ncbi:Uncharacterised protein [Mycobacterium tuberculosis]|nr:Uncharacterised protein [Mycobacterium tuberculosis]CMK57191.1 Uncharacterised protein [Mycobacterium tuberculosis]CMK95157.1 Uncharacterised protein [Mycobacterium tuberculosis]CMS35893.1 Uncharacterised protein [Mycobacterium tuberculosis]
MHRGRQRRLKRRRRRGSLTSRQLRLPGRRTQPPHIRRRRPRHRHRRRTRPRPSRQPGDHRIKRGRRGPQIRSQPLPRRRRHKQRPRPRTGIDPRRVDLRRQPRKIQNHRNPKPASRLNGSDTNQSRMLKQPTPKIRVLKKVLTPRGMIGVLTCRRAGNTTPRVTRARYGWSTQLAKPSWNPLRSRFGPCCYQRPGSFARGRSPAGISPRNCGPTQ